MSQRSKYLKRQKGPAIPPKGYLVQEIRDHLYWVTDGSYNTIFLVTEKGVVAVDALPSIGKNYLKAIAEVTNKPIAYVIYSHAHLDHIGAPGIFPKNATYISSARNSRGITKGEKRSQKCFYGPANTHSKFFQELYIADRKPNAKFGLLW